jgi:16S rRNA (guanine966-N2)-methyltransferase
MRVVAGRFRGRVLTAPAGHATRPTAARAKEALFAVLGDVSELRVLDLYAGSGALGIEALSRGASFAVFVESARPALACLRDNLAKLGIEADCRVLPVRAESALTGLTALSPFQLVLCDPPWKNAADALRVVERLASADLTGPGARIAFEHSARTPIAPGGALSLGADSPLQVESERHWGDTAVTLLAVRSRC